MNGKKDWHVCGGCGKILASSKSLWQHKKTCKFIDVDSVKSSTPSLSVSIAKVPDRQVDADKKPKKKAKAVKPKEVDEIPDVLKWNDFKTEKDADDFLEAFVKFADMQDMSVESLRGYYKANFKNITLLYDNFPEKKKELDDIVTKRKEEIEQKLSAKEAEKNG